MKISDSIFAIVNLWNSREAMVLKANQSQPPLTAGQGRGRTKDEVRRMKDEEDAGDMLLPDHFDRLRGDALQAFGRWGAAVHPDRVLQHEIREQAHVGVGR